MCCRVSGGAFGPLAHLTKELLCSRLKLRDLLPSSTASWRPCGRGAWSRCWYPGSTWCRKRVGRVMGRCRRTRLAAVADGGDLAHEQRHPHQVQDARLTCSVHTRHAGQVTHCASEWTDKSSASPPLPRPPTRFPTLDDSAAAGVRVVHERSQQTP